MRRRTVAFLALTAIAVSLAGAAGAVGEKGFPIGTFVIRYSTVTGLVLHNTATDDSATGVVKSSRRSCFVGRKVYLDITHGGGVGTEQFVGSAVTDSTGSWEIPIQAGIESGAGYFVIVNSKRLKRTAKHQYNCGTWISSVKDG
jgi:hypothetical protein